MPADSQPTGTLCRWKHEVPFAYSTTYDEGTVDTLASALPVHERFGFPGHVDLAAGQLGRLRESVHDRIEDTSRDGDDWLVTMQLAPGRTVHLHRSLSERTPEIRWFRGEPLATSPRPSWALRILAA